MRYLLSIMEPVDQRAQRSPSEGEAVYAEMLAWGRGLQQSGVLVAMESLQHSRAGRRVQVRSGEQRLTDGPFTEAKEMLGGFALVECESVDDAVALATACPAAAWATVEVRAVGPCFG